MGLIIITTFVCSASFWKLDLTKWLIFCSRVLKISFLFNATVYFNYRFYFWLSLYFYSLLS